MRYPSGVVPEGVVPWPRVSSRPAGGLPDAGGHRAAAVTVLRDGIAALGVSTAPGFEESCLAYLRLLIDWNRVYSLTAARTAEQITRRHVLDALALLPHLHGRRCLDLGSGAGLPGLVLALADPSREWVLLDASLKKTRFLRQVCLELRPAGVTVERCRAEHYRLGCSTEHNPGPGPGRGFDSITVRALGTLEHIHALAAPLCAPGGRILACKGRPPSAGASAAWLRRGVVVRLHALRVPGASRRCVVELAAASAAEVPATSTAGCTGA